MIVIKGTYVQQINYCWQNYSACYPPAVISTKTFRKKNKKCLKPKRHVSPDITISKKAENFREPTAQICICLLVFEHLANVLSHQICSPVQLKESNIFLTRLKRNEAVLSLQQLNKPNKSPLKSTDIPTPQQGNK